MSKERIVGVIVFFALVAAACGAGTEGENEEVATTPVLRTTSSTSLEPVPGAVQPSDPGTPEPDPGAPLPELPEAKVPLALQPFAAAAVADLAKRLGIAETEITVALAESVVWADGSLGCPQPGMAYTQVQVEGARAVLMHGQDIYFYHGGQGRPGPFLCENLEP